VERRHHFHDQPYKTAVIEWLQSGDPHHPTLARVLLTPFATKERVMQPVGTSSQQRHPSVALISGPPSSVSTITDVTRLVSEQEPDSTQRLPMADRTIVDVPVSDVADMAARLPDEPTPTPLPWQRAVISPASTLWFAALVDDRMLPPRVDDFASGSPTWRATVAVTAAIVLSVLAACGVGYGLGFRFVSSRRNHHV
jgi:hypothetical protein